ncbi:hypothetical protein AAG570_012365 [Ranatra chinensis]|uniref:Uncharacterized protein n=1 Tax=Ranatra chinensis TaxID=642074 RepID=A0ABD0Z0U1_9HEMI
MRDSYDRQLPSFASPVRGRDASPAYENLWTRSYHASMLTSGERDSGKVACEVERSVFDEGIKKLLARLKKFIECEGSWLVGNGPISVLDELMKLPNLPIAPMGNLVVIWKLKPKKSGKVVSPMNDPRNCGAGTLRISSDSFGIFSLKRKTNLVRNGPEYYVTQMITGHGNFTAKLAGFGLRDENNWTCGVSEAVWHVLLECGRYGDLREEYVRKMGGLELDKMVERKGSRQPPIKCRVGSLREWLCEVRYPFCEAPGVAPPPAAAWPPPPSPLPPLPLQPPLAIHFTTHPRHHPLGVVSTTKHHYS